jgi:putative SOS response-associated peptidase YedK
MCYHTKLTADAVSLANRLKAEFLEQGKYKPDEYIVGFETPEVPIVRFDQPEVIQMYEWGLMADYLANERRLGKNDPVVRQARNQCLNARIEELEEKKSFRGKAGNRCLVPMEAMFEWQWQEPGNERCKKTKFIIHKPDDTIFCCAGLYNEWRDPLTGEITYCYTICTTEGNKLMKEIKNEGERMLVVLSRNEEAAWLDPKVPVMAFYDRSHIQLEAKPLTKHYKPFRQHPGEQLGLF